jgi:hypothetical protein
MLRKKKEYIVQPAEPQIAVKRGRLLVIKYCAITVDSGNKVT